MKWVLKTSSVRVAKTREEATFRSIDEIPMDLRREIKQALEGPDSETIYIANQAAYNHIEELTQQRQGAQGGSLATGRDLSRGQRLAWAGLGAALSAATLTWILLTLLDKQ